jgi:hypothetical protein
VLLVLSPAFSWIGREMAPSLAKINREFPAFAAQDVVLITHIFTTFCPFSTFYHRCVCPGDVQEGIRILGDHYGAAGGGLNEQPPVPRQAPADVLFV